MADSVQNVSNASAIYLPASIIIAALILSASIFMVGADISGTGTEVIPDGQDQIQVKAEDIVDDDAFEGDPSAPVTIVEFSDFQCPFCGRFYTSALSKIRENYVKTGKVKIVYRDFPLSFHPEAQKSAESSECAADQGKFWEMHDKIFENQATMSVASYKAWAKELGMDSAKFNSCLDSGEKASEISKDMADGQSYGVTGTPTFFIGSTVVVGAQPYSAFQQAIDAELAQ